MDCSDGKPASQVIKLNGNAAVFYPGQDSIFNTTPWLIRNRRRAIMRKLMERMEEETFGGCY